MPEDEKNFILLLKKRDEGAFDLFIRKYQNMVFSLALRFLGNYNEAEDITQEIFITVFKRIDTFRGESSISTWLYRMAVNHCKNRVKYLSRRKAYQQGDNIEARQSRAEGYMGARPDKPDEILEARETEAVISQALQGLDEDHRTILLLRELESMSYQQIAEILELEEGTVKSKLHRARQAFYAVYRNIKDEKGS
ncbi:MAG: sigma-70 family RNA polymerase sigma factor [Pseudomonadota bacterium]